jgi:mannose-6-phosphate isomerase-like protein (cupin superfamily)
MAGYTIVNLKEIDESASARGAGIEARFGRAHLDSSHLGVSYIRYPSGHRNRMGHSHREQEEAYVVVSGSGRMKLGEEVVDVRQWDVVRIAPETVRAIEAGPDGIELIAVGSDRPEGGDGVAVDDWWID